MVQSCLLQPECNFLHGYFRCKLPVEVVDVEVKVTSMQGTHIFRMDQTTQLVRCVLWTANLHPHATIVKRMKTFLELENKIGPIIPAPASQFRPQLIETNPNVRRGDASEKRKRVTLKKRFRPINPRATTTCPPLLQVPSKSTSDVATTSAPVMVREDTPWPSTGKMSGNLFKDRNWLLPKGYLATEGEKEGVAKPYPKEEDKRENKIPIKKKKSVVGDPIALFARHKRKKLIFPINRDKWKTSSRNPHLNHKQKGLTL